MRKLLDGTLVQELAEPKTLKVYTKCPEKWLLTDLETGEKYIGYLSEGTQHWRKIEDA